ncbi:MAG TPA: hypothetical protein VIN00_06130 [Candidatus Dormibacteraeota bacterium]|jgi:hypothetical protein
MPYRRLLGVLAIAVANGEALRHGKEIADSSGMLPRTSPAVPPMRRPVEPVT